MRTDLSGRTFDVVLPAESLQQTFMAAQREFLQPTVGGGGGMESYWIMMWDVGYPLLRLDEK